MPQWPQFSTFAPDGIPFSIMQAICGEFRESAGQMVIQAYFNPTPSI
jgi:hypothetical protein